MEQTSDIIDAIESLVKFCSSREPFKTHVGISKYKIIVGKCKSKGPEMRKKFANKHAASFRKMYEMYSDEILLEDLSFLEKSNTTIKFGQSEKSQIPLSAIYNSMFDDEEKREDLEARLYFVLKYIPENEGEIEDINQICNKFEEFESVKPKSNTNNVIGNIINAAKSSIENSGINTDEGPGDFSQIGNLVQTILSNPEMQKGMQELAGVVQADGGKTDPIQYIGETLKVAQEHISAEKNNQ